MSDSDAASTPEAAPAATGAGVTSYSWYTLSILVVCKLFNYLDRNILSILAEELKLDLGLSDAQIGFLYGTAFAVFFAVFGIPFGRLADAWVRKNLIAWGLLSWSVMTALSGTARSFFSLAGYRIGVGVGESTLAPSAYSMLVDLFPPRLRATALALYSSGTTIGAGVGFFLGGWILDTWNAAYPDGSAPLGLRAWQVAFLAVGLPGVVMALLVFSLREPVRGQQDAVPVPPSSEPHPWREFATVIPPLTLVNLWHAGAGVKGLAINLGVATGLGAVAWQMTSRLGEMAQWSALAIGLYSGFSWVQSLRLRDPETFRCIFRSRAYLYATVGFAGLAFVTNGIAFWTAPFLLRAYDTTPTRVGLMMAVGSIVGGFIGMTIGGVLSDRLKARRPTGRVDMGLISAALGVPLYFMMVHAPSLNLAFVFFMMLIASASIWLGPGAASSTELVPAKMRSTSAAVYLYVALYLGFGSGPYTVGKVSDLLAAAGQEPDQSLGNAMLLSLLFWIIPVTLLWRSRKLIGPAEAALAAMNRSEQAQTP